MSEWNPDAGNNRERETETERERERERKRERQRERQREKEREREKREGHWWSAKNVGDEIDDQYLDRSQARSNHIHKSHS